MFQDNQNVCRRFLFIVPRTRVTEQVFYSTVEKTVSTLIVLIMATGI